MWTCAHCDGQVENRLGACPTYGARRYRALRWLAGALRVLGYVGLGWVLVYVLILGGEIEGWEDTPWFGGILTVLVGICVGTFAASEALHLATHVAADARAKDAL